MRAYKNQEVTESYSVYFWWPCDGMNGLMMEWMALWRDEWPCEGMNCNWQLEHLSLLFQHFEGKLRLRHLADQDFPSTGWWWLCWKNVTFFSHNCLYLNIYIYTYYKYVYIYIVIYLFWEFFVASPQIHAKTQVPQIFTKKIQTVFLKYHLWVSINSWPCSLCQSSKMKNVQKLSDHERIQLPVVEHLWSFFAVQGGLAPVMSRDNNPPKMALYSWVTGVMGPYEQTNRRDTL